MTEVILRWTNPNRRSGLCFELNKAFHTFCRSLPSSAGFGLAFVRSIVEQEGFSATPTTACIRTWLTDFCIYVPLHVGSMLFHFVYRHCLLSLLQSSFKDIFTGGLSQHTLPAALTAAVRQKIELILLAVTNGRYSFHFPFSPLLKYSMFTQSAISDQ